MRAALTLFLLSVPSLAFGGPIDVRIISGSFGSGLTSTAVTGTLHGTEGFTLSGVSPRWNTDKFLSERCSIAQCRPGDSLSLAFDPITEGQQSMLLWQGLTVRGQTYGWQDSTLRGWFALPIAFDIVGSVPLPAFSDPAAIVAVTAPFTMTGHVAWDSRFIDPDPLDLEVAVNLSGNGFATFYLQRGYHVDFNGPEDGTNIPAWGIQGVRYEFIHPVPESSALLLFVAGLAAMSTRRILQHHW